jgi:hypothetical protein
MTDLHAEVDEDTMRSLASTILVKPPRTAPAAPAAASVPVEAKPTAKEEEEKEEAPAASEQQQTNVTYMKALPPLRVLATPNSIRARSFVESQGSMMFPAADTEENSEASDAESEDGWTRTPAVYPARRPPPIAPQHPDAPISALFQSPAEAVEIEMEIARLRMSIAERKDEEERARVLGHRAASIVGKQSLPPLPLHQLILIPDTAITFRSRNQPASSVETPRTVYTHRMPSPMPASKPATPIQVAPPAPSVAPPATRPAATPAPQTIVVQPKPPAAVPLAAAPASAPQHEPPAAAAAPPPGQPSSKPSKPSVAPARPQQQVGALGAYPKFHEEEVGPIKCVIL